MREDHVMQTIANLACDSTLPFSSSALAKVSNCESRLSAPLSDPQPESVTHPLTPFPRVAGHVNGE